MIEFHGIFYFMKNIRDFLEYWKNYKFQYNIKQIIV